VRAGDYRVEAAEPEPGGIADESDDGRPGGLLDRGQEGGEAISACGCAAPFAPAPAGIARLDQHRDAVGTVRRGGCDQLVVMAGGSCDEEDLPVRHRRYLLPLP